MRGRGAQELKDGLRRVFWRYEDAVARRALDLFTDPALSEFEVSSWSHRCHLRWRNDEKV